MGVIRDLTFQRFGALVMLRKVDSDYLRRSIWLAKCDCGSETRVVGTRVTSGHVSSCGCKAVNTPLDLFGQRFGRLVVQWPAGVNGSRARKWTCICDCGVIVDVAGPKLKFGQSRSCGCLVKEKVGLLNLTHGMSKTPAYSSWLAMWARTTNPKNAGWENYGGRGITVCDRWRKFENFHADMGDRPEGLSIEREDNDQGYNPDNCVWADRLTQSLNKRPRKDQISQSKSS